MLLIETLDPIRIPHTPDRSLSSPPIPQNKGPPIITCKFTVHSFLIALIYVFAKSFGKTLLDLNKRHCPNLWKAISK